MEVFVPEELKTRRKTKHWLTPNLKLNIFVVVNLKTKKTKDILGFC